MLSASTEMIMSISSGVLYTAIAESVVRTENEGALNALMYTTMVHLFLHYHVYSCMIVLCFLATELTINPKSCCDVLWIE